jgi:hypothetical protein
MTKVLRERNRSKKCGCEKFAKNNTKLSMKILGADEGVHIFSNEGLHLSPEDSRIGRRSLQKATSTTMITSLCRALRGSFIRLDRYIYK